MPELPEVETIRRGIAPAVTGQRIARVVVREPRLRFAIVPDLADALCGQRVGTVGRRSKYLRFGLAEAELLLHLGMSGRLHLLWQEAPLKKHDHVDIVFENGAILRYHDPRRFGFLLLHAHADGPAPCLAGLGPEPLSQDFNGDYLRRRLRGRAAPIKSLLMDARIVVGVGNIYAQEALFAAGIRPRRAAGRLSGRDCERLVAAVRQVLSEAVAAGGTTLRDFSGADGAPGYFQQDLYVYGRAGQPCRRCGEAIRHARLGNRSTAWCPGCQPR